MNQALSQTKNQIPAEIEEDDSQIVSVEQVFQGPIPPPAVLEGYEKACPGAADRILSMAEKQSEHRREMEQKVVSSEMSSERIGMHYAFILSITLMILGFILLLQGKSTAGYFAIFGPAIFQAGSYILVKSAEGKSKEKEEE